MLYILFPAVMHVRRGVDLLVILLLLNNVASYILQYFVLDFFKSDNALVPSSRKILETAELPYLIGPPYRMTIAIVFALVAAVVLQWYFSRTVAGYEMRAVGLNRDAAFYAGVPVKKYTSLALLISGALAGIGGALEVLGNYHCLYTDFSPGFGYDGIPVALLCGSNPILAVVGSIAFGALRNGSLTMQAQVGISNEIISVIQGSLILFVASNYIVRYLFNRRTGKEKAYG
jgi:simple sugar transport system permease protein